MKSIKILKSLFVMSVCMFVVTALCTPIAEATSKDRFYFEKQGDVVWDAPNNGKFIALTFDDGPNQRFTPQILKLLLRYNAKATFFVIGSQVDKYPGIVLNEVAFGNEIGNHTFSHVRLNNISRAELQKELLKTQQAVFKASGVTPHLFRPPRGFYDVRTVRTARDAGFRVIIWSWDEGSHDWKPISPTQISQNVLTHMHSGDIILFHDSGGNRGRTITALQSILPQLKEKGFQCVTVSQLLRVRRDSKSKTKAYD